MPQARIVESIAYTTNMAIIGFVWSEKRMFGSTRTRKRRVPLLFLLLISGAAMAKAGLVSDAGAMTMQSYDLDSLVYMSSDIVLATVERQPDPKSPAVLTVTKAIVGAMPVGQTLNQLDTYLSFFYPALEPGQNVILFLDRKPREKMLLAPTMAEAPYAIVPSGIFLVDPEQHIRRYFQGSNPGPYLAQGYPSAIEKMIGMDAEADSQRRQLVERLPRYDDAIEAISRSISYVDALKPLLERTTTPADGSALIKLLKARAERPVRDDLQLGSDRLSERAILAVRMLGAVSLLLDIYPYAGQRLAVEFAPRPDGQGGQTNSRSEYLLSVLETADETPVRRASAAKLIDRLSNYSGRPIAQFADRIHETARRILMDDREQDEVRIACLSLVDLSSKQVAADLRELYGRATSSALRFGIESTSLGLSDVLYESLPHVPGPMTTIVRLQSSEDHQILVPGGKILFFGEYFATRQFFQRSENDEQPIRRYFVLTSLKTGVRHELEGRLLVMPAGGHGTDDLLLDESPDLDDGDYDLTLEYTLGAQIVGKGYPIHLRIVGIAGRKALKVRE